jgi:hypothetical protein
MRNVFKVAPWFEPRNRELIVGLPARDLSSRIFQLLLKFNEDQDLDPAFLINADPDL